MKDASSRKGTAGDGVPFLGGIRGTVASVVSVVVMATGCTVTGEVVSNPGVVGETRGAFTSAEMAAIEEFLAEDARGPVSELLATRFGVLAVFEDGVASFGVDPVAEAWRYESSGALEGASVSWDGETVVLRHNADVGPVSRQRTAEVDAESGAVVDSHDTWGEVPSEGLLLRDVWVTTGPEGVLVAHPFTDDRAVWERDLSDGCPSGGVDEVDLEPGGTQLFVSYTCVDDGSAHVEGISAGSGTVNWGYAWEDAPAPRIHVLHEHSVPGAQGDPIERMLAEGLSGEFVFFAAGDPSSAPVEPEPWRSVPGLAGYVDAPLQDVHTAPQEIVVHTAAPNVLHDRLVVQVARSLAEDEDVPFSNSDIDDSLLIDGELVENPRQWQTAADGYVGALRDELDVAFP